MISGDVETVEWVKLVEVVELVETVELVFSLGAASHNLRIQPIELI